MVETLGPDSIQLSLRQATPADAEAISRIYNHYIRHTIITFEEDEISAGEIQARIAEAFESGLPWLVAEDAGQVAGYAYASKWKGRCAYRFAVETTVYLAEGRSGRGIGSALYGSLLPLLRERGIHTAIAGIALPNDASVRLHEKIGMRKVAHFEQVGRKFERWIDVGYWQMTL